MHLGIDLGGTKIEIVALDATGAERFRRRCATPRGDYDATLAAIRALVEAAQAHCGRAASIGIGTPGAVVPDTGCMKNCNSTWLNGRPLPADLARSCGRAVHLANDADCFTLSEAVDGAGAGGGVVFGVILGTGVGGGIALHGRMLAGPNALAGEWGHNPLPELDAAPESIRRLRETMPSRRCYCGRVDCIETWLSGPGLVRSWCEIAGRPVDDDHDVAALLAAASRDEAARRALDLHAWQLAAALGTVINLLDPRCIVLGGGLSNLDSLYTDVPARWHRFVFGGQVVTPLRRALHGDSGGVRGAAWLGRSGGLEVAESGPGGAGKAGP